MPITMAAKNAPPRKIMVVADPTRESAGALQYAISHVLLEKDELILLHVENPITWMNTLSMFLKMPNMPLPGASPTTSQDKGEGGFGDVNFLEEMKSACKAAKPKIQVRVEKVVMNTKDKASTILSLSKLQGVDVIVIGQKKSLSTAILGCRRPGGPIIGTKIVDTAEYLIENSHCTCVAVQRKGQNGGYVLNSKTHRNFWLLA